MKIKNLIVIITILSVINACQSKKAGEEKIVEESTEALATDRASILPEMQSPAEVAAMLQSTGAEFNPLYLSDPTMASEYAKNPINASMMLGVYMLDLGYSIAFKEKEYVEKYYEASHTLAIALGAEKTFLKTLMNRYKENIESNDSLKIYFEQTYSNASETISVDNVNDGFYRTLFVSGFYIESLFTMLELIQDYPKDILSDDERMTILMPVIKAVLKQEPSIRNLYALLKEKVLIEDNEYQDVYFAFTDLIGTYDRLDIVDKVDNNKGGELLNDEVFIELTQKVDVIRSKIVTIQ